MRKRVLRRCLPRFVCVYASLAVSASCVFSLFSLFSRRNGLKPSTAIILTVSDAEEHERLSHVAFDAIFRDIDIPGPYAPIVVREGGTNLSSFFEGITVVEASRDIEREAWGVSFHLFSGIYGASVKPAAIRWLAFSEYEQAWIVEPDVAYTGSWARLFSKYDAVDGSDLVAFNTTFRFGENKTTWNHWRACVYCKYVDPWRRQASLLPAFRISRRLALELFSFLNTSSRSGHHEAMLPTFVTAHDAPHGFSWTDLAPDVGYVRWRPVFDDARASSIRRDSLYHPVKSPRAHERLSRAFSRPPPHPASSSHSGPPPDIFLPVVEEIR